ncbi:zinc ribbon domain-containing protein [Streptomyces decoyicus]
MAHAPGRGSAHVSRRHHGPGWSALHHRARRRAARRRVGLRVGVHSQLEGVGPNPDAFGPGPKPLDVREWTCGECGIVHDRDHNAARNVLFEGRRIVAAGRVETLNASWSAGKTRTKVPAQRGEAGSPRKGQPTQAGIPGL